MLPGKPWMVLALNSNTIGSHTTAAITLKNDIMQNYIIGNVPYLGSHWVFDTKNCYTSKAAHNRSLVIPIGLIYLEIIGIKL